jgi:hypothetical protein
MNLKVFYLHFDCKMDVQVNNPIDWYRNKTITFVGQIAKQYKSKNGCNFILGWNAFFQIFLQIFQNRYIFSIELCPSREQTEQKKGIN